MGTNDLTFNIAALDRASDVFVKLAGKVDKVGDRLDALDRKKADPKVDVDTTQADRKLDELNKKVSGLGNIDIGKGGLIGVGAIAGAGAAAAGGLLAIPAAVVAVGAAFEKNDPVVAQSFSEMTDAAKSTAREGFAPLTPALTGFANSAKTALGSVKTELAEGANAAAPLVSIVGDGFLKAAQDGIGASVPIIESLQPAAKAVADDLDKVEQGAMGFLKNLNVGDASQGLETLGTDVEDLLPPVGTLVSDVIPLGNAFLQVLGPALTNTADAAGHLAPELNAVASVISFLGPDIATYTPPALAALAATKLLTGSWTDFGGAINVVKPLVTNFGGAMDTVAQKLGISTAAMNETKSAEAAEILVKAELAKASAEEAEAEAEAAFAADASAKNAIALNAAQDATAASAAVAADAEKALAASSEAATFSFGPLGIALGAAALLALPFITNTDKASDKAQDLTSDLVRLAQAAPGAAAGIVSGNQPLSDLVNEAQKAGVNVKGLLAAYNGGPQTLQSFVDGLQKQHDALGGQNETGINKYITNLKQLSDAVDKGTTSLGDLSPAQADAVQKYKDQQTVIDQLGTSVTELTSQQNAEAAVAAQSATTQQAASGIADALGLSLTQVTIAYRGLASGQAFAMSATQQASDTILQQTIAVDTAKSTISNYFKQADQGAQQAKASLDAAQHSATQAVTAVGDAEHSYAQAQQAVTAASEGVVTAQRGVATTQDGVATALRGVTDAQQGLTTAENNVTKARVSATQAQVSLTAAEAAATEQLKALHLQLTDQVTTEQSARVSLFDQQQASLALGVTEANAQQIAAQTVTTTNETKIKSALDLIKAEESLNDTLHAGSNLRTQVTAADKAGVSGSQGVLSAQDALASAQQQVLSSEQALTKAHQAVSDAQANVLKADQAVVDAQANVVKAEQGVSDALYNEGKAHDAVGEAKYNSAQASGAVALAQAALTTAQDTASHSMDINTAAGLRNLSMLQQLATQLFANEDPQTAGNDLIKNTATLFGTTTTNAANYLKKLGLIPKDFKFGVTAVAAVDWSALPNWAHTNQVLSARQNSKGHLATGGQIFGPGGPRDDRIPAMLSNREFVQPVDSVDYYGVGFMEAVRHKKLPRHFASGGLADSDLAAANGTVGSLGIDYQDAAMTLMALGLKGPVSLPKFVAPDLGSIGGGIGGDTGAHSVSASTAQAYAASQLANYGWNSSQVAPLVKLWNKESNWDYTIVNKSSGAYGIPQSLPASKMASAGPDWRTNYKTQINWGLGYIDGRYETPTGAWAHETAFNWYRDGGLALQPPKSFDTGGWLDPGTRLVHNGTGVRERVRTGPQEDALLAELQGLRQDLKSYPSLTVNGGPQHSTDQLVTEVMRRLTFNGRG